jgi:hypothetical protein
VQLIVEPTATAAIGAAGGPRAAEPATAIAA